MAGLLVAIGIMSMLMSVAMPARRTLDEREKEAELLFRGQQYMRTIDLYQRQFPGAYLTDLEVLVKQRFLRRTYLDPMTGVPFRIPHAGLGGGGGRWRRGCRERRGRMAARTTSGPAAPRGICSARRVRTSSRTGPALVP